MSQFQDNDEVGTSLPAPHVRWSFALSPLSIRVTEHRKPLYKYMVDICAVVGGVFTVLGLLDAVLHLGVRSLRFKKDIGKHI